MRYVAVLTFFVLVFALPQSTLCQSANLPMEYWGYDFLERLKTKGLFHSHDLSSKPLSRYEFARIIRDVQAQIDREPQLLTRAEHALFRQLAGDLCDELECLGITPKWQRERHLLQWQEPGGQLYIDAVGQETVLSQCGDRFEERELISETTLGGILRGILGGKIGFYVEARNTMRRGDVSLEESFEPSQGSPVVVSGKGAYQDRAEAYFVFEAPWLRFELGRQQAAWGPGFRGGLALSRNLPQCEMIKLKARFNRFKFTSIHAFLRSSQGPKYLSGHRLELEVIPGLYIAGSETVIYGNRNVEFAYLNPLMPYHIAEHHLGDKDNNAISFDITTTLIKSTKLYAEFFIDDMTSTENWLKYYGNKFGVLFGGLWAEPFRIPNADIRLEYTRIEPFVYTHDDFINVYTHYDQIIGHWIGPNSDLLYFQAGYRFDRDLRITVAWERQRHGEGDVNSPYRKEFGTEKQFLTGTIEKQNRFEVSVVNQIRRDVFVSLRYGFTKINNISRIAGTNSSDHFAAFNLSFNY